MNSSWLYAKCPPAFTWHCHTISERQNLSVMSGGWAPLWALTAGVNPPSDPIPIYHLCYNSSGIKGRMEISGTPRTWGAVTEQLVTRLRPQAAVLESAQPELTDP